MKRTYLQLFLSTFRISACTFGGGFVIVPLLRRRFVEELGWINEQEMLDLTAIAQSSPGPIAVNAAILVGYRAAGLSGALVTLLGSVLPPLMIISLISLGLTLSLIVLNILTVNAGSSVGQTLNDVLLLVSAPMFCCHWQGVSLFLWACLFVSSFPKMWKK